MMAFVRFVLFIIDSINVFLLRNCSHIAGAIAFYMLFALFPLFLAMISVLGFVLGPEAEHEELAIRLAETLPVSSEFISATLHKVVQDRTITGLASVLGLLTASTAAFGAIRKGINAAWGISQTRPFIKERMIDFALVMGAGLLLIATLFSAPALAVLREITLFLAPETPYLTNFVWALAPVLVFAFFAFCICAVLYRYLPNTEVEMAQVWPGALLAAVALTTVSEALVWYFGTFPLAYDVIYGAVGTIMALLTWAYMSAIILLFGALMAASYSQYAAGLGNHRHDPTVLWTGFWRVRLRVVEPSRAL